MTTTIVSCFYLIKSKFPPNKYLEWIQNFFYVDFHCVIFCDNESKNFITESIPETKNSTNIIFKILNISDFEISRYDWENDLKIDPEIKKGVNHSIELYKIWGEKIFFLEKAILSNEFNSSYFLWIDIGSFRCDKLILNEIKANKFPQSHNFRDGKMSMFKISNFKESEQQNVNIIDKRFIKRNVYGGLFGGDKTAIQLFKKKYTQLLEEFKTKKIFAGKDQSVYNFLVLQNPELIHTIDAHKVNKKYDPWFCFHYYFSDYCKDIPVTVIIPIYNGIEFLEECIQSLKKQTYEKFSILIGINGHEFNSCVFKRAMQYANEHILVKDYGKFIGVINRKSAVLNAMISDVKTDWVALLDVDDTWLPTKLEEQINVIVKNNNRYDVIGTKCQYFGYSDNIPKIVTGDINKTQLLEKNQIINSSAMIRKNLCEWNTDEICEDYNLWLKLSVQKKKMFNINSVLVMHRLHSDSYFNTKNHKHIGSLINKYTASKSKLLTIVLRGGLGNQLFEIGTVLTLATKNNLNPVFLKMKRVGKRAVYWDTYIHNVKFISPDKYNSITHTQKDKISGTDESIIRFKKSSDTKLRGFFQNCNIIEPDIVKKHFKLSIDNEKKFTDKYKHLLNRTDSFGIHVRRTDFLTDVLYTELDMDYYKNAIKQMMAKHDFKHMLIFSDDKRWCIDNMTTKSLDIPNTISITIIDDKDYMELHLMRQLKGLIIANSTFSWWGAFLNDVDGYIICPKKWFTRGNSQIGLLPSKWVSI